MIISDDNRKGILSLARLTTRASLSGGSLPVMHTHQGIFAEKKGLVVSLYFEDQLCAEMENIFAEDPLGQSLVEMIDLTISMVRESMEILPDDLDKLRVAISIVDEVFPSPELSEFSTGSHGVIVQASDDVGALLPELAEQLSLSPEQFLGMCCTEELGLAADIWKSDDAEYFFFTTEEFICLPAGGCGGCGS